MTAEIDLPPLPERFNYTNGSTHWCYSRYTMTRDDLGTYVLAKDYDALRSASEALQAEVKTLQAEVERLKSMTAVTMGIGSGDGNLFIHGDYDSIKAAQALVFRAERMEKALRLIESAKDRGFGIDYARGVAQSILLHDQEE